jgi:hypothetical protein
MNDDIIEYGSGESEIDDLDELNEVLPDFFSITSYGADYPVDGLIKRLENKDIEIPTIGFTPDTEQSVVGFQRQFIWTKQQSDKFIESLLLGLPVPGIFLVKENNNKLLVLDGQQRLRTLQYFYKGIYRQRAFLLENVQEQFKNKTYETLELNTRRKLNDYTIHATIIKQDQPNDDQSSIYLLFERLNSGGTLLQPQEIRTALYHGELADLLIELNEDENWRKLIGRKNPHFKDVELILRFLAFYFYLNSYHKPMKDFLNRYMAKNRNLKNQNREEITDLFKRTVSVIISKIGKDAFRPKSAINAAATDSIMVGVAKRMQSKLNSENLVSIKDAHSSLFLNKDYITLVSSGTADDDNVKKRFNLANEVFMKAI